MIPGFRNHERLVVIHIRRETGNYWLSRKKVKWIDDRDMVKNVLTLKLNTQFSLLVTVPV
jgi:hypothetical protein